MKFILCRYIEFVEPESEETCRVLQDISHGVIDGELSLIFQVDPEDFGPVGGIIQHHYGEDFFEDIENTKISFFEEENSYEIRIEDQETNSREVVLVRLLGEEDA